MPLEDLCHTELGSRRERADCSSDITKKKKKKSFLLYALEKISRNFLKINNFQQLWLFQWGEVLQGPHVTIPKVLSPFLKVFI